MSKELEYLSARVAAGRMNRRDFLGRFGSALKEIQIDEPSLETVFLTLTGRELRERDEVKPKARGKRNKRI